MWGNYKLKDRKRRRGTKRKNLNGKGNRKRKNYKRKYMVRSNN